ncbi:hypothetical protein NS506_00876 [Nocardia seriolae]|uniref:Uncharacterized protein n=1 Tax=Nocardia seriolae TaxID=37332 RepID=A0ABC8ALL5_9NOCA|nr:hypothetical protein [Nocardia seriolae]APA94951.1 hypothetical protein NS506_00876 [Nocardia seriolae]
MSTTLVRRAGPVTATLTMAVGIACGAALAGDPTAMSSIPTGTATPPTTTTDPTVNPGRPDCPDTGTTGGYGRLCQ